VIENDSVKIGLLFLTRILQIKTHLILLQLCLIATHILGSTFVYSSFGEKSVNFKVETGVVETEVNSLVR